MASISVVLMALQEKNGVPVMVFLLRGGDEADHVQVYVQQQIFGLCVKDSSE
ncbi:hypothetical protein CU012_1644 [Enterococcus faecium]|nr:hypothetical protein [Enterococcus faecium]